MNERNVLENGDYTSPTALDTSGTAQGFLQDHHLDHFETWLDSKFSIGGFQFGLDGLIGLVPVVGDVATTGISTLFVADAWKVGARKRVLARMIGNIGIDFVAGSIPLVGDLFDFAFKSNTKNLRLLREERRRLAGLEAKREA
ncbi:MAG: DUF4112 domain-containing protein [Pseudomonadota bacterium]